MLLRNVMLTVPKGAWATSGMYRLFRAFAIQMFVTSFGSRFLPHSTRRAQVCLTRSIYQFVSSMMSAPVLLAKSYGNEAKYKQ